MRYIVVVLAFIFSLFAMPQIGLAAKKTQPVAAKPIYAAPMRVVIVRNSSPKCEPRCPQWIDAEGEITSSTPQAFNRVFKQMGKTKLPIIIRSPGGSIEAALQIGKMIRARGLTVAVGYTAFSGCSPADQTCKLPPENKGVYYGTIEEQQAFCNSACPMLMAGGTTRLASFLASVGVHQPKTTWTRQTIRYRELYRIVKGKKKVISRKEVGRINLKDRVTFGLDKRLRKTLSTYYASMGIDLAILDETNKASFENMNFLSEELVDKLHVRTSSMLARYLASPSLCGTTATSAVCIEDASKDPEKIATQAMKKLGIDPNIKPMSFRVARLDDPNCKSSCPVWVAAEGVIVRETPAQLKTFIQQQNLQPMALVLNSPGGDGTAAMETGRLIRQSKLEAMVGLTVFSDPVSPNQNGRQRQQRALFKSGGHCDGVCMLVFAGGNERHADRDTEMSVHNPLQYGSAGIPDLATQMNLYLAEMGVRPGLLMQMHQIKGKAVFTLTDGDMSGFSLATDGKSLGDVLSVEKCKQRLWDVSCLAPDS